ncbi:MAG: DUF6569 family protein [Chitinophagales bacterium]
MTKSTLILLLAFVSSTVFAQYKANDLHVVSQDIGKPFTYKHLQLFPIYANNSFQEANQHLGTYVSLQKAIENKQVSISEIEVSSTEQVYDLFSNSMIVSQELTSYEENLSAINPEKSHRVESEEEGADDVFSIFDDRLLHPDARMNVNAVATKLFITNHSQDTIFLMAGEVLKGGRQDRVIAQDMIVPPNSDKVHLPVFCAEKDRWYYRSKSSKDFDQYFAVSSLRVRKAVSEQNDQLAVWNAIEDLQVTNNIDSKTKAYTDLKASMNFNTELEDYVAYFTESFEGKMSATKGQNNQNEKMVGVIVATGGNIVGCDIFATHDLFVQQYEGLIHSYATDAITYGQKMENNAMSFVVDMDEIKLNQYLEETLKLSEISDDCEAKEDILNTSNPINQEVMAETLDDKKVAADLLNSRQKVHFSSFE